MSGRLRWLWLSDSLPLLSLLMCLFCLMPQSWLIKFFLSFFLSYLLTFSSIQHTRISFRDNDISVSNYRRKELGFFVKVAMFVQLHEHASIALHASVWRDDFRYKPECIPVNITPEGLFLKQSTIPQV